MRFEIPVWLKRNKGWEKHVWERYQHATVICFGIIWEDGFLRFGLQEKGRGFNKDFSKVCMLRREQ